MKKLIFSLFVVLILGGCASTCVDTPPGYYDRGSNFDQLQRMNPLYEIPKEP